MTWAVAGRGSPDGLRKAFGSAVPCTVAAVAALVVVTPQGSIAQQPGHPQHRMLRRLPRVRVHRPPPALCSNAQRAPSSSQQAPNPQRPPASFVRPVTPPVVNPNAGINPNVNPNPNLNRVQPFHNNPVIGAPTPFGGQPRMAPEPGAPGQGPHIGAGPVPPHNVVVGPGNGLRLGPGRPMVLPGSISLQGRAVFRTGRRRFPVVTVRNRFFPIVRGPRFVWWGGYRRAFVPLAVLGIAAIGGSYWYPDGYVSVAQPYCTGLTPDGCQLTWRMVDFDGGGAAPQCVQYCPQVGPPLPGRPPRRSPRCRRLRRRRRPTAPAR